MNLDQFKTELKKLNIKLSPYQLEQLNIYCDFLLEYNKHTNLTAIKNKNDVFLKHFFDCLTILPLIENNKTLLDIGTGAGFPGLVLAIFMPNLKVTLLDSNNKKINFLSQCLQKLNITNVKLINERAEKYTKDNREQYDYITSRAVANLSILLELGVPALKINGHFIAMKGNANEELEQAKTAMQKLNVKLETIKNFNLPNNEGQRTILNFIKMAPTSLTYPRSYDKIKKKNL